MVVVQVRSVSDIEFLEIDRVLSLVDVAAPQNFAPPQIALYWFVHGRPYDPDLLAYFAPFRVAPPVEVANAPMLKKL